MAGLPAGCRGGRNDSFHRRDHPAGFRRTHRERRVVIEDERIVAVGPEGEVVIPDNAQRVELGGRVIMPGLVDTHSHIGGVAGGDSSDPIQPAARVLDSIDY